MASSPRSRSTQTALFAVALGGAIIGVFLILAYLGFNLLDESGRFVTSMFPPDAVTTQGAHYLGQLTPEERARYDRGDLVVRYSEAPGTSLCTAFHPEASVRGAFIDGFELAEFVPGGATGNPYQDLVVLRVPAS